MSGEASREARAPGGAPEEAALRLYLVPFDGSAVCEFGRSLHTAPLPEAESSRIRSLLPGQPREGGSLARAGESLFFRGGPVVAGGVDGEFVVEIVRGPEREIPLRLVELMRRAIARLGEAQAFALAENFDFLLASASSIISSLSLESVLQNMVDGATRLLHAERGSLMLVTSAGELEIKVAKGLPPEVIARTRIKPGEGIAGEVLATGRPVLIRDIEHDARFARKSGTQYNTASLLSVPLLFHDRVVGVFNINNKRNGQAFDERDLRLLCALASLAAAAIENARQYEQLVAKGRELDDQIEATSNLYEEQHTLYECIRTFRHAYDRPEESRDRMVEMSIDTIGAKVGILVLIEDGKYRVAFARGFKREEFTPTKLDGEEHLLARLVSKKLSVILNGIDGVLVADPPVADADEVLTDPFFFELQNLIDGGLRNAILVPLHDLDKEGRKLGAILVANRSDGGDFTEHNRNLLAILAGQIEAAVSHKRLLDQFITRKSFEKELDVAKSIQSKLLPKDPPAFDTINIDAHNQAAKTVSGDYYDFLNHGQDYSRLGIIIGDVAGKGIPAALIMAMTRAILRTQVSDTSSPALILERSNRFLNEDIESNRYVTMVYAVYDVATRDFTFAKAGHNPPIWYKAADRSIEFLETEGFPLGMFDFSNYADTTINLAPGDKVILYTDGITEAMNEHQEEYSIERLCRLVVDHADFDSKSLIERIMFDVEVFSGEQSEPHDDLTIIVLSVDPFRLETEVLDSSREAVVGFAERFVARCRDAGVLEAREGMDAVDEFELYMVLDELLINAAEHGNAFNPDKKVRVSWAVTPYKIEIVAEDEGRGFDWKAILREKEKISLYHKRGRGLQIMQKLFDKLEYNEKGNRCRLVKYLR